MKKKNNSNASKWSLPRKKLILTFLTHLAPASQKGHTHSNKSSAKTEKNCLSAFCYSAELVLKGFAASFC